MREMLDEAVSKAERIVGEALSAGQVIIGESRMAARGSDPDAAEEPGPEILPVG